MFPSSSSGLGPTRTSASRPSSALSQRPTSAQSQRPLSSLSLSRPLSRVSAHSRQAKSKLIPLCHKLVKDLGVSEGEIQNAVDFTLRSLETTTAMKSAASVDMDVVVKRVNGHIQKAKIQSFDKMAEALESCLRRVKEEAVKVADLDNDIKTSKLPDHLQLLLQLSHAPSPSSLAYADSYLENIRNPPQAPKLLTWETILAEEPFEGEHWKGVYGLPPGSVKRDPDDSDGSSSLESSLEMSPLHSELDLRRRDSTSSEDSPPVAEKVQEPSRRMAPYTFAHRTAYENLKHSQYWRPEWRGDADVERPFNLGDPSTLGPAYERLLAKQSGAQGLEVLQRQKYIYEEHAVREVLFCLQGRRNIMFSWVNNAFKTTDTTPRLLHLTLGSQQSILSSFANMATTLQFLRSFSASVFTQSQSNIASRCAILRGAAGEDSDTRSRFRTTRTLEAFAAGVDVHVRRFDSWCSAKEQEICYAKGGILIPPNSKPIVISLLSLEKSMQDMFEDTFSVILSIIQSLCTLDGTLSISSYWPLSMRPTWKTTTSLLDRILEATKVHGGQRGNIVTASHLMDLFVKAAEPVWKMVRKWLEQGMGVGFGDELEQEFFIERNDLGMGDVRASLMDSEFWAEGYTLRQGGFDFSAANDPLDGEEAEGKVSVPIFMESVAEMILASGKAKGLLRAMDKSCGSPEKPWQALQDLVGESSPRSVLLDFASVDWLGQKVEEQLKPYCQLSDERLASVIVQECGLLEHLKAIEDLFLMRRGDCVSHFLDIVFAKMDTQNFSWADFHFLNTAFRDVVSSNRSEWINSSFVRLSYSPNTLHSPHSIVRTVKALDGLRLEYAVPFPLHYIFTPVAMKKYSDLFVYLTKLRRAKSVLERILLKGESGRMGEEVKIFYAMRGRLSWFINTLLHFLTTHVIDVEVSRFHKAMAGVRSIDEMINLHNLHLDNLSAQCLLDNTMSSLHQTVMSILDMALWFSRIFYRFRGDATMTHEISSVSRTSFTIKSHRSKRRRKQSRNSIGLTPDTWVQDEESSDSEDDADVGNFSTSEYSTYLEDADESPELTPRRIERLSKELDSFVKAVRKGVEKIAGGTGYAAPAFNILAFQLEDWDI
ncbi:Spc98 family-domain-containing protein [Flagelloscypha sp. PMI_526]|nr:Spc98 family-domain-containing protein [Flagelloscypha sp. PMI_526]